MVRCLWSLPSCQVLIFRPTEGKKLCWCRWLVTCRDGASMNGRYTLSAWRLSAFRPSQPTWVASGVRTDLGTDSVPHPVHCRLPACFVDRHLSNKKHLKNVGPIRHCEPPLHCHSPGVACRTPAIAIVQAACDVHYDDDNAWVVALRAQIWTVPR